MNNYLVTGGNGFIGKYLVRKLRDLGKNVKIIDTLPESYESDYYQMDISEFDSISPLFKGIDCVIHLAALSNTQTCINDPLLCNKINITGTLNVLEASRIHGVKRVVCASSHVVQAGMHPLRMSKIAVENYCELYTKLYGVSVICLRYAMVYGQDQIGGNVLNAFRESIRKNGYITILGDGQQNRDFLHVTDCVRATYLASESMVTGIIDICSGQMHTLNHIATNLLRSKIKYLPKRLGDADTFSQSAEEACKLLHFQATIPLEVGIRDYYDSTCLIGYTGAVGLNLVKNRIYDDYYNSKNIREIRNKVYNTITFCALPGTVWYANQNPDEDFARVQYLIDLLKTVACKKFILISTINVYEQFDSRFNESHQPSGSIDAYGRHRMLMETYVKENYSDYHIIRLSTIYGDWMEKGIIYDLLHENYLDAINVDDAYQFYDLNDLSSDIDQIISRNLQMVNLFPEPISVRTLLKECFPHYMMIDNDIHCVHNIYCASPRAVRKYDICTNHGNHTMYWYDKSLVISKMQSFLKNYGINDHIIISNIAWNDGASIYSLLQNNGINMLEIAPTKLDSWEKLSYELIKSKLTHFKVYSLQSITYGLDHLNIFDDSREQLLIHIKRVIHIFADFGVKIIIFGCPRNRMMPESYDKDMAISFFRELGDYAHQHHCCVAIETICRKYGCNYVNTIKEAIDLIERVDSMGFGLHVDTGNLYEENENPELLRLYKKHIKHVQISVFGLTNFDQLPINYNKKIAMILNEMGYEGKISIEMRATPELNQNTSNIKNALKIIQSIYGYIGRL